MATEPRAFALIATKLSAAAAQARSLPRAWRLVLDATGASVFGWLAMLCLQGLVPAVVVVLSRPLVDHLAAAVGSGVDWTRIYPALEIALAIGSLLVVGEVLRSAAGWLRAELAARVEDRVADLIQRKSIEVDLAFYESSDFHDHLHRAREEARYRPTALLDNAGVLAQNAVTLLAVAAVLASYGVWMALALLASTLPALVVVVRFAVLQHRFRQENTADERRAHYYDWLMTSTDSAAELRLFGLGDRFRAAFGGLRSRIRGERRRLSTRQAQAEVAAAMCALVVAAACLGWIGWRAMQGESTLGDIALFYLAFSQGQKLMRALLAGVGQVYYNVLFLGSLFEFLDLRSTVREPAGPRRLPVASDGLEVRFEDVTFHYPGSNRMALRNFDLAVRPGEIAAIVGANGAGKSTLLKLACRFYDPQAGRVLIGGDDVRYLALADVRGALTALFQQSLHYGASVAENIAPAGDASEARLREAAQAAGAGALIDRLPHGYATLLGRWFPEGIELSVGEWQRLALARAFLRASPIILLDEPTSAMDPWAEAEWMNRFRALARGRTAIIVTHRFTTAMQADVIHVMHEGRIVESGPHLDLLAAGARYARSWEDQQRAPRVPSSASS